MSKLEELIQQYCPDGVEWKPLGDYLSYEQPTKYLVANTKYDDSYLTPVLTAGQSFILGYTNEKTGIFQASKDIPVIIFDDFTTSFHWVDFSFKVKSSAMKMLRPTDEKKALFRYLYYCMKNIPYVPGDHTRQWIGTYSQIEIPVPPLPVQEEIVRILDTFTELQAELQAELQKRKQQYNYYLDNLLSFNDINRGGQAEVRWMKMNEVFEIRNGYTPSKAKKEFWEGGTIPWFRMEDIRQNGRILSDSILHITPKGVKGKGLFKANSFILATTATIGEHALIIADSLANQQFTNLSIRKSLENELSVKYVYYYFFVIDEWCKANTNVSNFASVDMSKFYNLLIPIPSISEQQRIVSILDRFDTLTTDLTQGLPAEIEKRRQQYEYYRDKLLTFKRKGA
ncbi:MAG: restriction endonuclease subunit S [Bacteroidales bacterium]|nr:restriction endonuclease subunit S [Bacteroidales bacterium]